MKPKFLWILCIVAILASIGSIIIGVVGQELATWKNVSIQEFEFKGRANCVLFVETKDGIKLECSLTNDQKEIFIQCLMNKVEVLGLKLEKQ